MALGSGSRAMPRRESADEGRQDLPRPREPLVGEVERARRHQLPPAGDGEQVRQIRPADPGHWHDEAAASGLPDRLDRSSRDKNEDPRVAGQHSKPVASFSTVVDRPVP